MHYQLKLEFKTKSTGRSQNANVAKNLRNSLVQGFKIFLGVTDISRIWWKIWLFLQKKDVYKNKSLRML